jgi:hypothetical protein
MDTKEKKNRSSRLEMKPKPTCKDVFIRDSSEGDREVGRNIKRRWHNQRSRCLPEGTSRNLLSEVRRYDTPLQGANSSGTNLEGGGPKHVALEVGRHRCLDALGGSCVKANQAGACGTQQAGNLGMPKQGKTKIGNSKRPRSEGSTPMEMVRPSKKPKDYTRSQTYIKALTNIKTAIFKENYPEDKPRKLLRKSPRRTVMSVSRDSERRTATPVVILVGGRRNHMLLYNLPIRLYNNYFHLAPIGEYPQPGSTSEACLRGHPLAVDALKRSFVCSYYVSAFQHGAYPSTNAGLNAMPSRNLCY